jgi:hypothetical protein
VRATLAQSLNICAESLDQIFGFSQKLAERSVSHQCIVNGQS